MLHIRHLVWTGGFGMHGKKIRQRVSLGKEGGLIGQRREGHRGRTEVRQDTGVRGIRMHQVGGACSGEGGGSEK